MANNGNYTFYPQFNEYVKTYQGVTKVWIADGTYQNPGTPGVLYAGMSDNTTQELGFVSDYETAKQYFAELGISLTYQQWIKLLSDTPENVNVAKGYTLDAEAYAKGTRNGVPIGSSDQAYHNNSKYYSEVSADKIKDSEAWARGTKNGVEVGSSDITYHNNSKYYSEVSADRMRDSEAWAQGTKNGVAIGSSDPAYNKHSKYYSEIAETARANAVVAHQEADIAKRISEQARDETIIAKNEAIQSLNDAIVKTNINVNTSQQWAVGTLNSWDSVLHLYDNWNALLLEDVRYGDLSGDIKPSTINNSMYYAKKSNGSKLDAEAWAVGKRDGVDVPLTDETYHNNAKYYAELAASRLNELSRRIGALELAVEQLRALIS